VNTAGYMKTRRKVLTADELVETFGLSGYTPADRLDEVAAAAAAVFEVPDDEELVGLWADCSAIAADLAQPFGVRRLAATVALAAESAHGQGATDWDRALDWVAAAEALYQRKGWA
jgi:hypothetical protein